MRGLLWFLVVSVPACARAPAPVVSPPVVETADKLAPQAMVAAANPLAVDAGLAALRRGGGAVDAAVTIQTVLGLVEPQSSGLGGGAFLVYYDASTGRVTAYDGREVAPAAATSELFLEADEQGVLRPMAFENARKSGRSIGAPGVVAMLAQAHADHGTLPWGRLFDDAADMADRGFAVSPRLAGMIASSTSLAPEGLDYFTRPDGARLQAGDTLKNPVYAETLRRIGKEGPRALYEGPLADEIVARARREPMPGQLTRTDLAGYRPRGSEALCRPYRQYRVCVAAPPSGGVALLEGLGILEGTAIAEELNTPEGWFLYTQASRLMYADRDRYVGDPAFVDVPVEGLLDHGYVAGRRAQITHPAGPAPGFGLPPGAPKAGGDGTREVGGTSHVVVVDPQGNVVSMTTSVESAFGSGRMAGGFFLNNQLTDFSFAPTDKDGTPAANAVAPGKRPRSSMSPLIVLDEHGRFLAALGSPGGPAIVAYCLKAIVGVLDWRLPMQEAIALPNVVARGERYSGEVSLLRHDLLRGLSERGVNVQAAGPVEVSGINGVIRREHGYEGGSDPRREGVARGF